MRILLITTLLILIVSSCASLQETSKYEFISAKYHTSIIPTQDNKVYLSIEEDTIAVYPVLKSNGREIIGKQPLSILVAEESQSGESYLFSNPSFDIDLITHPIKYRFAIQEMPQQLTSQLNGSIYLGFRNDLYRVRFIKDPLDKVNRKIRHTGLGAGFFGGIGSEPINPWVTNNGVEIEYDGFVLTTGTGGIVGVNNFTIGLSLGFDFLLDSNRSLWIYQGKPWLGILVGINLN